MLRKALCAMFVMTVSVALIAAEEFTAAITKVEGTNVTFQKYKKGERGKGKGKKGGGFARGEKEGDPMTLPAAGAKVTKGSYDKDAQKLVTSDVEGGLTNKMFTTLPEDGLTVRITTSEDNKKITQITTFGGGRKKKDAQ